MDTNVMHTYKSLPEEPVHHVQYDQVGSRCSEELCPGRGQMALHPHAEAGMEGGVLGR